MALCLARRASLRLLVRFLSWVKLGCYRMENSTGWPPEADRVDHPGEPDDAGSVDVSYWDKAAIEDRTPVTEFMTAKVGRLSIRRLLRASSASQ